MEKKNKKYWWLLLLLLVLILLKTNYFRPLTNFGHSKTVTLDMDMDNAVLEGITLPSAQQTKDGSGLFDFRFFQLGRRYHYYKIYYQNESYKFPDTSALSNENFYGSWEDVSIGFKPITHHRMKDAFRIVGNPRDERLYYGADLSENNFSPEHMQQVVNSIHNVPEWYNSIVEKAETNGRNVDEQLYMDALWVINDKRNSGDVNHRWNATRVWANTASCLCYAPMKVLPKSLTMGNISDRPTKTASL